MADASCPDTSSRYQLFDAARRSAGWTLDQLWMAYLALGGTFVVFDVDAYLAGLVPWPAAQQDVLACALNERLSDLDLTHRVPYVVTLPSRPGDEALQRLLRQLRPPSISAED